MLANKWFLILGSKFLFLAVALGAFGAHGLKDILDPVKMNTYQTGVTYQFYHGFALLITTLIAMKLDIKLKWPRILFCLGIVLFSFFCYIYALTGISTFAMIVPVGGLCFLMGWFGTIWSIWRKEY